MNSLTLICCILLIILIIVKYKKYKAIKEKRQIESYKRTDSKWLKTQIRILRRSKYKEKNKIWRLRKGR